MSLIGVTPAQASDLQLTQQAIMRRLIRDCQLGAYGSITSSTAKNEFVDSVTLKSGMYSEEEFATAWVRIDSLNSGLTSAPYGEIRPVDEFRPEEGRIIVSPQFTVQPAAGDTYTIIRALHPRHILDFITDILTNNAWVPDWAFASEFPDGDMEQNNTTSYTGVNGTVTKQTAEPLMYGRRYLRVANTTGGDDYAKNASSIFVEPGKGYHLSAAARCSDASTTAALQAWDVTNDALIKEVNISRRQMVRLFLDLTVPSTCKELQVRFVTRGAIASYVEWDGVILYPLAVQQVALPFWVHNKDQIKRVFRMTPQGFAQQEIWLATLQGKPEQAWDFRNRYGDGRGELYTMSTMTAMPMFIYGLRNEVAFTDDTTDKKQLRADWFQAWLGYKVFDASASFQGAESMNTKWIDTQLAKYTLAKKQEVLREAHRLEQEVQQTVPNLTMFRRDATATLPLRNSTYP